MSQKTPPSLRDLEHHHAFIERHIGPNDAEIAQMLRVIGHDSLDGMTDAIVPGKIKSPAPLAELEHAAEFRTRHIGPTAADERHMLSVIGAASHRALIESVMPRSIARAQPMALPAPICPT